MKVKTLFTINSIIAILMGIACIMVPEQLLSTYDVTLSPMGLVIYQFWGTALIGIGMLTWFVRNIQELKLQRAFALSLFCANGLSCAMAIRGQFAGANVFGWSTVGLFLLLAFGFGLFLIMDNEKKS